ncbi:baseplate J/gp47 family protein [uncultured Oscillibacter sp.]|jgi:hypothetical protein|uniref:baseplate J/gp47 family protein n=1 Tax=uncultured Oscillibacter sp. TaxID=876091 RepID=UPI0025FB0E04|nr:baseplate J/gp47 family protein [uncultured Oscillibacter sp.]
MGVIGSLGDVAFTVSRDLVRTLDKFQWSGSARYGVHQRHAGNALTEFTGLDPDQISLDLTFSAELGTNPMEEIWRLFRYERNGTTLPLTLGEHAYGRFRWTILSHTSAIVDLFDYYDHCENVTVSDGGADRATDEEYYELMRASMDSYSCAGAKGGYIYFAKQVSTEIADVIAASPTPGVVKLYVLMKDGTQAGEEIKSAVLAACSADDVRPLTDLVTVEDAETAPYNVAFTYYTQKGTAKSASQIATDVQAAVDAYTAWQGGKLGRDVNPSHLTALLMDTGVKRVELAEPAFMALRDGSGKDVPQVAKLGTVTITNGGYEDE